MLHCNRCWSARGAAYPLQSWQDILLTSAEMELDSTTMFPPGTNVMFIRSMGEPVLAQVVGHSEHGDAYRRITYDRDGKIVLCCNFCACKCVCTVVVRSPRGGLGDRHLATVPQGLVGDRLPWGGERQAGGGGTYVRGACRVCRRCDQKVVPISVVHMQC